jgi:hypothetical protein
VKDLGWEIKTDFDSGINSLIEHMKKQNTVFIPI